MSVMSRRTSVRDMETEWEIVESGPADARQTVLLLPGGMCSARSYAEVMAEPSLDGVRLIAATMPGHAGAPRPDDFSAEHYVQITAELAKSKGVDVIAGFSMGAQVAFNMVVSGAFAGPVVLLGISLSSPDEPLFFRAIIRLGSVLGTLPAAVLKMGIAPMVKKAHLPPERQAELIADFKNNSTRDMRRGLLAYADGVGRGEERAGRFCEGGGGGWWRRGGGGEGAVAE